MNGHRESIVILSEAKDLCTLPKSPLHPAKPTGPSARKERGTRDAIPD